MKHKKFKDRSDDICDECIGMGVFKIKEWPHQECRHAAMHEINRGFQQTMNGINDTQDLVY